MVIVAVAAVTTVGGGGGGGCGGGGGSGDGFGWWLVVLVFTDSSYVELSNRISKFTPSSPSQLAYIYKNISYKICVRVYDYLHNNELLHNWRYPTGHYLAV
jgi:hypothetical protein